jgi:hypothetical protein
VAATGWLEQLTIFCLIPLVLLKNELTQTLNFGTQISVMQSDINFESDYTGDSWCDKFCNADIKNTPHDDNYLMCETFGEDIAKGYWCQVENEDV